MKGEQRGAAGDSQARRVDRGERLAGLPEAPPAFIPPMRCKLVERLPAGEPWVYELKLDGYRALAIKTAGGVKLLSRNKKDLSLNYPEILDAIRRLRLREGVLDGEIVALDASGKPCFQDLQNARGPGREPRRIFYFAFDLLNLDGKSLLALPLAERKLLLKGALRDSAATVRFLPFLEGRPEDILREIERQGLEGIVAKLKASLYEPEKRTGAWSKLKIGLEQEFVIGGYTRGRGGRAALGALIVGYYDQDQLRYASKVGTGFSNVQIRQILEKAAPFRQAHSPFDALPESQGASWSFGLTATERKTAVWLQPVLVCRVRFSGWTQDGHLRHPAFEGIREDKSPREVVREYGD